MYIEGHMVQDMTIDCSEFSRNVGTDVNGDNISAGLVLLPAAQGDVYSNITIRSSQFDDNPFAGILVQPADSAHSCKTSRLSVMHLSATAMAF